MLDCLRRILQKTVVPFRRKREEIKSKIRLSMNYRISLNYMKLLFVNGIVFFVLFAGLYLNAEYHDYERFAEDVIKIMQKKEGTLEASDNPFSDEGVTVRIWNTASGEEVYNDLDWDLSGKKGVLHAIYYEHGEDLHRMTVTKSILFERQGEELTADFQFNMTRNCSKMFDVILIMALAYAALAFFILYEGKVDNEKLLEPIKDMTDMANRLTVNSLGSERINVEGTNNELKDLAGVINQMLDRLELSYESQKQFVSDASHELRTPIAVIQGYTNMLARWGAKDPEILQESIEALRNEAASMQELVEKLLFLSRHDKKTLKLEKKRFNMRPVVEEIVKETRLVAANRNIECPCLEDVIVYGDKQSLKQAVRVFIDNACKYTQDGDTIRISCANDDGDCVVKVVDTGIGMTRKDVDNIFNRFYRSDEVRDRNISGHGLGLSIAKLIILGHTGRIKVRSQYTKGTEFTITIPDVRRFYGRR